MAEAKVSIYAVPLNRSTGRLGKAELRAGVDPGLAGRSVFDFDSCVRYVCRGGFSIHEMDMVNGIYCSSGNSPPSGRSTRRGT